MATRTSRIRKRRPKLRKGHPMAQGLVAAYAFPGGSGQDLVGGNHLTINNDPANPVVYDGDLGMGTLTATSGLYCAANSTVKVNPPLTVVWQGTRVGTAGGSFGGIFGVTYKTTGTVSSSNYSYGIMNSGAGPPPFYQGFYTASGGAVTGTGAQIQGPASGTTWCVSYFTPNNQSNKAISVVGDPNVAAHTNAGSGGQPTFGYDGGGANTSIVIFGNCPVVITGNSQTNPNVYHDYGLIYRRAFTLTTGLPDIKTLTWLYTNGRDLFVDKKSWLGWTASISTAAGGSHLSLLGNTGIYAEVGSAATLQHTFHAVFGIGSFLETGFGTALTQSTTHNQTLSPATGTYTELGKNATFISPTHLVATTGSYLEAGLNATTVKLAHPLVGDTGTYFETGQPVTPAWVSSHVFFVSATSLLKIKTTPSIAGSDFGVHAASNLIIHFERASCTVQTTYFYPTAHNAMLLVTRADIDLAEALTSAAQSRLVVESAASATKDAAAAAASRLVITPHAQGARDIAVSAHTSLVVGSTPTENLGVAYCHASSHLIITASCPKPTVVPFGAASHLLIFVHAASELSVSDTIMTPGGDLQGGTLEVLMSGLSTEGFPFSVAETGNGVLLLANGIDPMIRWDCIAPTASFAGVAPPEDTLTMQAQGNGLIQGLRWAFCRFRDQFGNYSNPSAIFGPVMMGTSGWIDVITVGSDSVPVCTARNHQLVNGSTVTIQGVSGLPISGAFSITVRDVNTFALNGIFCSPGTSTSSPSTWAQGAAQVQYLNVPVPGDPKIIQREILRNLDGNAQVFYVDVSTTDITSTTFWSSRLDDSLSAQSPVPLAFTEEMPEAARYDPPPSHLSVLACHLGRVFGSVDQPYDSGNVVVSYGSAIVQGIGTSWQPTFVGRAFYCAGQEQIHHVAQVATGQFLVLDTPYLGQSSKFAAYSIRPSDTEARLVYYSEPNAPEAWPSWNAFAVPDHGDRITGLMVMKSYLYIIEQRNISSFTFKSVPGRDGFLFSKSNRGCLSNRCWVIVENVAYMLDEAGIHRFDGESSEHISAKITPIFSDPTYSYRLDWAAPEGQRRLWHAVHDPVSQFIRWFVDFIGQPRLTMAICYDYRRDRWWLERYPEAVTSSCDATIGYRRVLAGTTCQRISVLAEGFLDGIRGSVYGSFRGTVAAATATTIQAVPTEPPLPVNLAGVSVTITSGIAKGAVGIVIANLDEVTLEFWKPWPVAPRAGDTFLVGGVNFRWRNGWLPYLDSEEDYSRDVSVIFKPTSSSASFDLNLFFDYTHSPQVWTSSRSVDGVTTIHGSPDINILTDRTRGYAFQRMQSRREIYGQGSYFVSLEVAGSQGIEATRIFEIILNGVYSQARQH